jgi:hypothetical protein
MAMRIKMESPNWPRHRDRAFLCCASLPIPRELASDLPSWRGNKKLPCPAAAAIGCVGRRVGFDAWVWGFRPRGECRGAQGLGPLIDMEPKVAAEAADAA